MPDFCCGVTGTCARIWALAAKAEAEDTVCDVIVGRFEDEVVELALDLALAREAA